jgi:hypothetical protein
MSVVVMPVCHRPEFLALALEKLDQAVDAPDDVRIYLDTSNESRIEEVEYVRDTYLPRALLFHAHPHSDIPSGTHNILQSINASYHTGAELVFLIEEDILINPETFFQWHVEQHTKSEYLASCGRKTRFNELYGDLYSNPGSCLSRELIAQVIPHINPDYFSRLRGYLDEHFGKWDEMSELDDGLIRRVIRQMGGKAVYPKTPVARHIGFRFYNKLDLYMNQEETIEGKIARLREIISKIRPGDRYATDFEF